MKYRNMEFVCARRRISVASACALLAFSAVAGTKPWAGKKVSILGDSISTFCGTPGCSNSYYGADGTNETGDVIHQLDDGKQWWQRVIADQGAVLEKNQSRGQSPMVVNKGSPFFKRAADGGLGDPDVIAILGGANDNWVYSSYLEKDATKTAEEVFRTGITNLFEQLDRDYPKAGKYVVLLGTNCYVQVGTKLNCLRGLDAMYREVQREEAQARGYTVIDLVGTYPGNPAYGDCYNVTHPTEAGLEAVANCVLATLNGGTQDPEPTSVAPPTAKTGLAYTGKKQTGVAAAAGYTVSGGKATDAGSYTATATLAAGYQWTDGTTAAKSIPWSIAKGVNSWTTAPSVTPSTWAADQVPATITINNGANTFGAAVTCDTTESELKALSDGTHTVTFTAAGGGKNYDAITQSVTVTVTAPAPVPPAPTGDDWGWSNRVTIAGTDYCVLAYTNTLEAGYAWTVPGGVTAIDYLVVGGGGAGGAVVGGGGGAGGMATGTVASVTAGSTFAVKVGAGGAVTAGDGGDGVGSSLYRGGVCVASVAGGGGGGTSGQSGHDGGCGGGGGGTSTNEIVAVGGSAVNASFGNAGGSGTRGKSGRYYMVSGGGGGAGAAGHDAKSDINGSQGGGGAGLASSITGEEVWYAGGGGGAISKSGTGAGGQGGGGQGGSTPAAGTDGLGGGGGGARGVKYGAPGRGGGGVVIIRYAVPGGGTTDPVVPGAEPKRYDTQAAAVAAKPSEVTPKNEVSKALNAADLAAYKVCFTIETRQDGEKWVNVAVLTETATEELQAQVNGGAAQVVSALAGDAVTLTPVTPGFYYALECGETLASMEKGKAVLATDSAGLTLDLLKWATSGFYRVRVTE